MRNLRNLVTVVFAALMITSCKKELAVELPLDVVTDSVSQVDWSTANVYSEVKNDGESVVSFRGVVWDTKPNPTLELNTKTDDGRGLGSYQSKIQGLIANTQYFVRSYAVNSNDTTYGNELTFKTSSWTPKEIKNIFDWWESSNGIVKVGDKVFAWTGSKGNSLVPYEDDHMAVLKKEDSDWGNQPSVSFNPNFKREDYGYYTKSSPLASSKTVILIAKVSRAHEWGALINLGYETTTRFGIWAYRSNSFYLYDYSQPAKLDGKFQNNNYMFIRISYNREKGGNDYYVNNTVNFRNKLGSIPTAANRNYNRGNLFVGGYGSLLSYGHTPQMNVVEVLSVDGVPDEKELDTYEKYLKYKYKL